MKPVLTKLAVSFALLMALTFVVQSVAPAAHAASIPASSKAAAAVSPLACPPTIGYGNAGSVVKKAQNDLNLWYELGLFPNSPYNFHPYSQANTPLKVDGIFGINTENATKDFQTLYAPPVDGIIGPITWHALGEC